MESVNIASTRADRKAATRQALLQAARTCFERAGFTATTIGEITRAANVAHGTFYVHFASKEAVIDQLLRELNLEFAGRLASLMSPADRPLEQTVRLATERFIEHWEGRADFVESYMQRVASGFDRRYVADGVNRPMLRLLAAFLEQRATQPSAVPWELVAHGILAIALRIGLQYLFSSEVTKQQAVETIVRLTLGAIRSTEC